MNDLQQRAPGFGVLYALIAFTLWGLFPLYWVQVRHVPALEVIAHRVVWGAACAGLLVLGRRFFGRSRSASKGPAAGQAIGPRLRLMLAANGVLVVANWLIYVWAVSAGRTLDASLGYYINPLVSVVLGMIVFGDRLNRLQWIAVGSAVCGVVVLTVVLGVFPWVSLALAFSFGTYGVIKKKTQLAPMHSLTLELSVLVPIAVAYIILLAVSGESPVLGSAAPGGRWIDPRAAVFLLGGGLVTVTPLVLFGMAAQRVRLSDVGFFQYVAPTLMFIIAVTVLGEELVPQRLVGFAFVWLGLAIYTVSLVRAQRSAGVPTRGRRPTG